VPSDGDLREMRDRKFKFGWGEWRGRAIAICMVFVSFAAGSLMKAQAVPPTRESESNVRLLTAEQGRAIVNTAWQQDRPARGTQDCSHLVHQIYEQAGYQYAYADSFELYAGNEDFARVRTPQPGDLIVWPGHVGIIIDPLVHSFYSLVRTGLDAQDYEGAYWKSRGRPHFYRLKVQSGEIKTAGEVPAPRRDSKVVGQHSGTPVIAERSPTNGTLSNRPPKAVSERKAAVYGPRGPVETRDSPATPMEVPQSIIIAQGNKQPTRDEVEEGISELSNAAGNVLRTDNPMKPLLPVVIFERLHVERLDIKGKHGWARLRIDYRVSIAGGEAALKRRHEKVRWELRRTESGWEAVLPSDRTYVPEDAAVRHLAANLAALTASDGAAAHQDGVLRQESQLANLLSALLEKK
jgi:hypothetical protein